jgi:hypothetical protein
VSIRRRVEGAGIEGLYAHAGRTIRILAVEAARLTAKRYAIGTDERVITQIHSAA